LANIVPTGSGVTVTAAGPDTSSIITITAVGSQSAEVQSTLTAAVKQAGIVIRDVQMTAGATDGSLYTALTTTPPQITVVKPPSRIKLMLAFAIIGVFAAGAVSIAVERGLASHREKRDKRPDDIASGGGGSAMGGMGPRSASMEQTSATIRLT